MKNQIQSQLEVVTINEVKENLQQIKNACFSESELKELDTGHIQTLAGFYVTKIALKKIINQQYPNHNITEKQIILTHNPNGAPSISEIISFHDDDLKKFHISISHTSENAYGFAAIMDTMK